MAWIWYNLRMFKEKLLIWDKLPEGGKSNKAPAVPKGSAESVPARLKRCKTGRKKECENLALQLTAGDLFAPAKESLDVRREDIPRDLPSLLSGASVVESVPTSYDPKKPNLYLIGVGHVGKKGSKDEETYAVQEEALRTFHVLYGLGVRRQVLEGVLPEIELKHNVRNPILQENPIDALPVYKRTGKTYRAYIAIEGIYGDKVSSQGADEIRPMLRMTQEAKAAEQDFPFAMLQIMTGLCDHLRIPYNRAFLQNPPSIDEGMRYLYTLRDSVRMAVGTLTTTQIEELVNNYVLANPEYKRILDTLSNRFYERVQGRDKKLAAVINGQAQDTAFVVGAGHIEDLKSQIRGYNIFVIRPKSASKASFKPSFSHYTLSDYRRVVLEGDLYEEFGLRLEKPRGSKDMFLEGLD